MRSRCDPDPIPTTSLPLPVWVGPQRFVFGDSLSIKVMSLVWSNFRKGGSEKLAMLALADWCDDKGESLYPSIASVAEKINVSECQARRIVHGFITDGYLSVVGNEYGGKPGQTRRYKLDVKKLERAIAGETPSMGATPSTHARRRVAPMRETPSMDARDGLHPCDPNHQLSVIEEPSKQPSVAAQAKKTPAPSAPTWDAYNEAYRKRYGVSAVRNAKVNGELVRVVQRIGSEEAPHVAAFFVSHNNGYYIQRGHSVDCLVKDAEKLRMEWATNTKGTQTQARMTDETQTRLNVWGPIIEEGKQRRALQNG